MTHSNRPTLSRRRFIASGAALLSAPAILHHTRAYAANPVIKIGHVSPRTGPLAGFAEADEYVLDAIVKQFASGISNNGKTWTVEIISKDSQSNPNRAAEVAADLILDDEVDILVAASTPDTVNPVSDQAEVNEVPSLPPTVRGSPTSLVAMVTRQKVLNTPTISFGAWKM